MEGAERMEMEMEMEGGMGGWGDDGERGRDDEQKSPLLGVPRLQLLPRPESSEDPCPMSNPLPSPFGTIASLQ